MYEALKSYFLSEDNAPLAILQFFKNEISELWLFFLQAQLQLFNDTLKKIEGEEVTALEVSSQYFQLLQKYNDRLENNFFPFTAKSLLLKLVHDGATTEEYVYSRSKIFYSEIINYLNTWSTRFFEDAHKMKYFLLKTKMTYNEFQESFTYFHTHSRNYNILHEVNDNDIFDTYSAIAKCVEEHLQEWEKNRKVY